MTFAVDLKLFGTDLAGLGGFLFFREILELVLCPPLLIGPLSLGLELKADIILTLGLMVG